MGPDEDHHHHQSKQESEGDRILLLLLQIMLIGIFLVIILITHIIKNRKYKECRLRQIRGICHEFLSQKEYSNLSHDALEMLRFKTINNDESQKEEEEEDDDYHHELQNVNEVDCLHRV